MYNNHTRHPPPHQMYAPPSNYKGGSNSSSIGSGPQFYTKPPSALPSNQTIEFDDGPKITVFIGNISEKVPDNMIKKIIAACGPVANWKRVSTFGFCEYDGPKSGARAVRLLHDFEVDGKKLVAKVDAKNQELLNIAKDEENKKSDANNSRSSDVATEKRNDDLTSDTLKKILDEFKEELKAANTVEPSNAHPRSKQTQPSIEIEEGKRDLINKEIGRFRKYAEEEEAKKEKDKKKREAERAEKKERASSPPAEPSESKSSSKSSSRRRSKSRSRSRERERREREREQRERERERDRERREIERKNREMEMREKEMRERERFREEPKIVKNPKEIQRDKEMAEEEYERRRAQKRAREKQDEYMSRLELWEARERKKSRDYEKQRDKDLRKQEKREKEAKAMKEFLEDYDDERDDPKYYKGKAYKSRMTARLEEADEDMEDKDLEVKELDKLKAEIFSGKYENPAQEFERQKQALENKYKPKIVLESVDDRRAGHKDKSNGDESDSSGGGRFSPGNHRHSESPNGMEIDELSRNSLLSNSVTPNSPNGNQASSGGSGGAGGIGMGFSLSLNKRRKIDPKSAFNMDDENEDANGPAKKKLVPLDYDENIAKQKQAKRDSEQVKQKSEADIARSQEEKRKMHKQIIDKIPIDKEDLFNHPLDRQEIDGTIKKKVQSWINKKIIEYIGEPEPTLVDFICSKLLAGSSPQSILDDVKMILDEEADIFVVKMWRLLIFEVEAKKLGIK